MLPCGGPGANLADRRVSAELSGSPPRTVLGGFGKRGLHRLRRSASQICGTIRHVEEAPGLVAAGRAEDVELTAPAIVFFAGPGQISCVGHSPGLAG